MSPIQWIFLFHDIESKCQKCEVVEFDYETNVYETNDDRDFKTETVDNFPSPFNEFYISQDSFKDIVDKYVVNIS